MSQIFQIQTPNEIHYISNNKLIYMNAPIPNQLGPEVIITNISIKLTNPSSLLLITGMIPVNIIRVFFNNVGFVLLKINVYDIDNSLINPVFSTKQTIVANSLGSIIIENSSEPVNFQFLSKINNLNYSTVKTYSFRAQLLSTVPIKDSISININSPINFFNLVIQQIS